MAHPNAIMRQRFTDTTAQYQLAVLKGARFVSVSETKRGVELEEAAVKQISEPFTYRPQFKLWLSTNHKPEIPDGSEGIWDRIRLIPFLKRFEGKGADPKLPEKLREEFPGVLAWAVRGCVEWAQHGLGSAAAVERATAAYRAETDTLEQFFEDRCYFYPEAEVSISALFEAWEAWCDENGEETGTKRKFTSSLREKGGVRNLAEAKLDRNTRGFRSISVSPPVQSPPKKSCKQEGRADSQRLETEGSEKFSRNTASYGDFSKNEEVQSPVSPGEAHLPSEDDYVEGPTTLEVDGKPVRYMPTKES